MNSAGYHTNKPSLIFHSSAPKLLNISALRTASLLWHQALLNDYPWRQNINEINANMLMYKKMETLPIAINNWNAFADLSLYDTWKKSPRIHFLIRRITDYSYKVNDLNIVSLLKVRIPDVLKEILRRTASQMGIAMLNWISSHFDVFDDRLVFETIFIQHFDDLVWRYDGKPELRLEQTAKKLLNSSELNDWDKFKLACEYCFEDDIRTLWPKVSQDSRITEFRCGPRENFNYWVGILKKERKYATNTCQNRRLIEKYLIKSCARNRSSLEYFWKFIPAGKRVRKIISCLMPWYRESALLFVLAGLNEQQWYQLMNSAADDVIIYMLDCISSQYVIQVWTRFKHIVSDDQFTNIVSWIFEYEDQTSSYYFTDDVRIGRHQIWIEAPDRLKQHALNEIVVDAGFATAADFLNLVLSDATFEQRNQIWRDNWRNLIQDARIRCLNEIMELCLGKENIAQFKELEMAKFENIENYCIDLMARTCFKELDVFLNFVCSSDVEKISYMKQRISQLWRDYAFCGEYAWNLDLLD